MAVDFQGFEWSEREDSNLRPLVPQTSALTGLRYAPTGRLIVARRGRCNALRHDHEQSRRMTATALIARAIAVRPTVPDPASEQASRTRSPDRRATTQPRSSFPEPDPDTAPVFESGYPKWGLREHLRWSDDESAAPGHSIMKHKQQMSLIARRAQIRRAAAGRKDLASAQPAVRPVLRLVSSSSEAERSHQHRELSSAVE